SLFYGVRLGMTYDDFYWYCFNKNLEGVFKPNIEGTAVVLSFTKNFGAPVDLEFFPKVDGKYTPITKYRGVVRYKNFSFYNKEHHINNLISETIHFFEGGYGGNKFIAMPSKNNLIKYDYVKIDGNRKIFISPAFEGDKIFVEFEDLKPIDQNGI
ncbi:MAG: hypothetical protein VXW38_16055, partial [Bacteroidota bacterium]|nr:hypothetical protein [Bacteroidota bacterium]